jgi:endonuclease G
MQGMQLSKLSKLSVCGQAAHLDTCAASYDQSRMFPVWRITVRAASSRPVLGILTTLVMAASACSSEPALPSSSTCAGLYSTETTPALLNSKLSAGSRPLCFRAFAILYSGVTRTPLYVAEHLTRSSVEAAWALDTRDNRFHPEPKLHETERAELADYRSSGFDRGHMAPSGDMGTPADDHESFSLANIVPQNGPLNRNSWADLESYVRDLSAKLGEAYVVTGPAFEGGSLRRLNGRVLVPSHLWKAVYVPGQGAGAWIVSNDERQQWEIVSIASLASRTGIDPFPKLDAAAKTKVPAFPTFNN